MSLLNKRYTAWADRFLPIPGLIITTTVCCAILVLQKEAWRGSEAFASFISNDRTTVAIIVQVISHILGLIQVQILGAVLRSSFMVAVKSRPFSIRLIEFIHDASMPRLAWGLPGFLSVPLILIVSFSLVPPALWSGALTPTLSERTTTVSINIPTFATSDISEIWAGDNKTSILGGGNSRTWMNSKGVFSFDAVTSRYPILNSASEASVANSSGSFHQKLDKTGYVYHNRSYGAGSAAGLVDVYENSIPKWYTYNETNFLVRAKCAYNESMQFWLKDELPGTEVTGLALFSAHGVWPNGTSFGGWKYLGAQAEDFFAMNTIYNNKNRSGSILIITGATPENDQWGFLPFSNTQCTISFETHTFNVVVNNTNNLISVLPTSDHTNAWPPYADWVAEEITGFLWRYTYTDASVAGSQYGRSFRLNANQLQAATSDNGTATFMRSIEDFLESCADNMLVHLLSTRLVAGSKNATTRADAIVTVSAVVIGGDQRYLYATLALNFLIVLIYTAEVIRTRAWKDIHSLDLANISSVILGILKGDLTVVQPSKSLSDISLDSTNNQVHSAEVGADHVNRIDDRTKLQLRWTLSNFTSNHGDASVGTAKYHPVFTFTE